MELSAENFNLYHLGGVISASYPPRGINTEAFQVTLENIGALSVEYEEGLSYDGDGTPYFYIKAKRGEANSLRLPIFPGSWIVVLWDQLYVFRDAEFKNTFRFSDPQHELMVDHSSRELPEFLVADASPELKEFNTRIDDAIRGDLRDPRPAEKPFDPSDRR